MSISRRSLLFGAAALPLAKMMAAAEWPVCFFSKPLQTMDWTRLARSVREIGFSGIDLTVRPGGHVLPERVKEDLPKAFETIRGEGLDVPMITTELLSVRDPSAAPILEVAGKLGIPFCKPGYYKYKFADVRAELAAVAADFRGLAALAKSKGVKIGYHNHTGNVGGPMWDIEEMLVGTDPKWAGYYFDPAHAVAEGGGSGWKVALNRIAPRIFMTSIKDFTWEHRPGKGWQERFCPLGEGMVDWKYYFRELARARFAGPISLHIEYDTAHEDAVLASAKRDLDFLRQMMRTAQEP